jgi:Flp pilus assembly protein TadG
VELAFILPIMLMLLTAIFMFSFAMYCKISLQTAADQGVRTLAFSQNMGVANPCTNATTVIDQATVLNSSSIGITFYSGATVASESAISTSSCPNSLESGTVVTVTTTYPCSLGIYKFVRSCQLSASESEVVP